MKRRDVSFTIALCASLVVHAAMSIALAEKYVRDVGTRIRLPGFARAEATLNPTLLMPTPNLDSENLWNRLGNPHGTGDSIESVTGELPQLAREGPQNQPFLSRDPAGPGEVGNDPSESLLPQGAGEATAVSIPSAPTAPQFAASDEPSPLGMPVPRESPPLTASRALDSRHPGVARPPADPADMGDSELDPVSTMGSVEFRRGSTEVRFGRKYKIIRPRLTLGAQGELLVLSRSVLVLKFHTDVSGNVMSVDVMRPSGSPSLDHICKVAAYEWWFEPPTDPSGVPRPDSFLFTIWIN